MLGTKEKLEDVSTSTGMISIVRVSWNMLEYVSTNTGLVSIVKANAPSEHS